MQVKHAKLTFAIVTIFLLFGCDTSTNHQQAQKQLDNDENAISGRGKDRVETVLSNLPNNADARTSVHRVDPETISLNDIRKEPEFTIRCIGRHEILRSVSNAKEALDMFSAELPSAFEFNVSINADKQQVWIHNTKATWPLLRKSDNELKGLIDLTPQEIRFSMFVHDHSDQITIDRVTTKMIGHGAFSDLAGKCERVSTSPIPEQQI